MPFAKVKQEMQPEIYLYSPWISQYDAAQSRRSVTVASSCSVLRIVEFPPEYERIFDPIERFGIIVQ